MPNAQVQVLERPVLAPVRKIHEATVKIGDRTFVIPRDEDALHLQWASGNIDAKNVISTIGRSCQIADDLVDERGMEDPGGKMVNLVTMLVGSLPNNDFYARNRHMIEPVLISSLLYWDLANTLSKGSRNDKIYAYAYRELIEQIVGIVALLTGGPAHARQSLLESHAFHHVLNCETFETYEKEVGA
jgi:hypothetical protein